jgi:hypothetical protein
MKIFNKLKLILYPQNYKLIIEDIKKLSLKYPNDQELGKEIRNYLNKTNP